MNLRTFGTAAILLCTAFSGAAQTPAQTAAQPQARLQAPTLADPFTLSAQGSCPSFHCTPEGTSLMRYPLPKPAPGRPVVTQWSQSQILGNRRQEPGIQSCSADGRSFLCLYDAGLVTALAVDAGTLTDYFALGTDTLRRSGTSPSVAVFGEDGSIIVADGHQVRRLYRSSNSAASIVWSTDSPYSGDATVATLTPLRYLRAGQARTAIAVTDMNGQIFAVDASSGALLASADAGRTIASPPVAHEGSLYYVSIPLAGKPAFLARFDLVAAGNGWAFAETAARFLFAGTTGGSPLYYAPADPRTGRARPRILLHVPNGEGSCGAGSGDHLVSLDVGSSGFSCAWTRPLSAPLLVSPVVDPVRGGAWLYPFVSYGGAMASKTPARLQHVSDEGVIDVDVLLSDLLGPEIANPLFIGHVYAVAPPGDASSYLVTLIGAARGKGEKYAIAIRASTPGPRPLAGPSLLWKAPVDGLAASSYGAAMPLVTLPGGRPGLVVSAGGYMSNEGNVVILGTD